MYMLLLKTILFLEGHGGFVETQLNNALVTPRIRESLRIMRRRDGRYWDKYFIRIW